VNSLRRRLLVPWALSILASAAVAVLLVQLYRESTQAQVQRAAAVVGRDCGLIRDRYVFYVSGWSGAGPADDPRLRADLTTAVSVALAHEEGVEGGVWQTGAGSLAYAYPTYAGGGPKTDLPAAERDRIEATNLQAAREDQPAELRAESRGETLLLHACPLPGPLERLTAWTMTRVRAARGFQPLELGLGILMTLTALMSVLLGRTLLVWSRRVSDIEAALASAGADGIPAVQPTGERELDRVIAALNDAGARLARARAEAQQMGARVARSERLASLGRVAAGVAHEIRNPIAAARLQGENALAGDDMRRATAIRDMLVQMDRLDVLVSELLAMTQRVEPKPVRCDLGAFLEDVAGNHRGAASARHVALRVENSAATASIDAAIVGRILDNLLANAVRHTPDGGSVVIRATRTERLLSVAVEDSGPGVPPDMADRLFEPFATGRPDGTGLGLAIARELADAHRGRLELRMAGPGNAAGGAAFVLELPQEDTWPQS
jgi:signal transduction histidine kinase